MQSTNLSESEILDHLEVSWREQHICACLHVPCRWSRCISSSGLDHASIMRKLHFEGHFWLFWRHWEK